MLNSALYYEICFLISVLLTIAYICLWHDGLDVNMTCLFVLLPIVNLGCVWMNWAPTFEMALVANKIVYLAGCFWPVLAINAILGLCHLKLNKRYKIIEYTVAFIFYGFALNTDKPGPLYRSVQGVVVNDHVELLPEYGWLHTVIYVVMAIYVVAGIVILIYAMKNKVRASIKNMYVMMAADIITMIVFYIYGLQKLAGSPAILYVVTQFACLVTSYRSYYYDIDASVMDTIVTEGKLGYITFDRKKRLLGCNAVAESLFPELRSARADKLLDNDEGIKSVISECLEEIEQGHGPVNRLIPLRDRVISMTADLYYLRGRKASYRIIMEDDTDHQNLVALLNEEKDNAEQEKKHASDTLHRYVDPGVADKLLAEEPTDTARGEERNIAVLFADIRGFTALSEKKSPREIMKMLNLALEAMTSCVMNNRGTVDKIIGDCVMATWNAVSDETDFVRSACRAAAEMQQAVTELGKRLREEFGLQLHIGIGISSGLAIVGDVGTTKRSDFTAIGDTVNVASRLEGLAAADEILVTEEIAAQLGDCGEFRSSVSSRLTLKGRTQETSIYRLERVSQ